MIVLCANDTSWDLGTGRLIRGGQGDRYLAPIMEAMPAGSAVIRRHPTPGPHINVYMNHREIYRTGSWRGERASVMISHGIASKTYRNGDRGKAFSHVVVPGPALAEEVIASGVPAERVHQLGYPKLDPVHNGEIVSPWPERDGRIRVLWAPTHGGGSERWRDGNRNAPGAGATTWWARDTLLALLDPQRCLIVEAPHPRHHPQRQATLEWYVGADVAIADGGSTIYESWLCGLPVVFADWLTARRNLSRAGGVTLESTVYGGQIGWHAQHPGEFADLVAEAANVGISAAEVEFAERVLPTSMRGHGGKLHAELLLHLDHTIPIPRPKRRNNPEGPPMRFISEKYPELLVAPARVKFRRGEATVTRPEAQKILLRMGHLGVRAVDEQQSEQHNAPATPAPGGPPGEQTAATDPPADASPPADDTQAAAAGQGTDPTPAGQVPDGGARDVMAWVGDDPARARQALEAEQSRDKPRTTLVATLTKLADG